MTSWRLARSLVKLRTEIDAAYPRRSKVSDGAIGDANHQARDSDHNPWVPPPRGGVVTAIDVTHDPDGGVDCNDLADYLRGRAKSGDKRIKYVIWNRRICSARESWAWRPYRGANAHTHHLHLSVVPLLSLADSAAGWGLQKPPKPKADPVIPRPVADKIEDRWGTYYTGRPGSRVVSRWDCGKDVEVLQKFIGDTADDGYFGADTQARVTSYQRMRGIPADGVAGPKTWAPILKALGL
jgi:peptidoglycan hydrolase-like protein with peptidoglycan-binding domain